MYEFGFCYPVAFLGMWVEKFSAFNEHSNNQSNHYLIEIIDLNKSTLIGYSCSFQVHPDKYVSDMTHFCPPGLGQVMMHTVDCIHEIIEFMEQLLSVRLPFSCFKTVFVNESYADFLSFAGVSVFSVGLLFSEKIIDQVPKTMRKLLNVKNCIDSQLHIPGFLWRHFCKAGCGFFCAFRFHFGLEIRSTHVPKTCVLFHKIHLTWPIFVLPFH